MLLDLVTEAFIWSYVMHLDYASQWISKVVRWFQLFSEM